MKNKTLTEGTPWKLIVMFALPIFLGRVFQFLYGLVDTKIVGSILGENALAGVGAVSSLYNFYTSFINGLTLGFSVVVAVAYGANKINRLKKAVALSSILGLVTIVVIIAISLGMMDSLLRLINVPDSEYIYAKSYIVVLIGGLIITLMYNYLSNMLRAIGDSVTPLIYLIIASVINIALDYIFILAFHMGVAGAAWATIAAQLISVILCLIRVKRKFEILHVGRKHFVFDRELTGELYKNGISMAMMSSLVSMGTVALQSSINTLGTDVIIAHVAARKIFEICNLPYSSMGAAMATYSGQNYGAGKYDRIRQGLKNILVIAGIWAVIQYAITRILGRALIAFVASTGNMIIIDWGDKYLLVNQALLFVCAAVVILRNTMQGFGDKVTPLLSSGIELAGKIVFSFILVPVIGYWAVIFAEPVIWILMVIPLIVKTVRFLRKY